MSGITQSYELGGGFTAHWSGDGTYALKRRDGVQVGCIGIEAMKDVAAAMTSRPITKTHAECAREIVWTIGHKDYTEAELIKIVQPIIAKHTEARLAPLVALVEDYKTLYVQDLVCRMAGKPDTTQQIMINEAKLVFAAIDEALAQAKNANQQNAK